MSTYKLKSIAQRSTMLVAAAALVVASFAPVAVYADALNPLTERSLLLSSSAPGWQDTDGSGYSEANSNPGAGGIAGSGGTIPGHYAPAGSGANGKKTGQTFSFKISTEATSSKPIKAFTLQYCLEAAGLCKAPGNNAGDKRDSSRKTNDAALADKTADLDVNYASAIGGTDYKILVDGVEVADYADWTMSTSNVEDDGHSERLSGKRNMVTLASPTGITAADANAKVQIIFVASEAKHITNPGTGSFFVKMNTYDTEESTEHIPAKPAKDNTHIIDGGVTVANVMADSIHITTKVLETMAFSVGTQNPDNVVKDSPAVHGTCEPITTATGNRLELGNVNAESSIETTKGHSVSSYWRLSSNSSGGATVYYSGETLTNTVGDKITPMPVTKTLSQPGTEQFGLAFESHGAPSASFTTQMALPNSGMRLPSLHILNKSVAYDAGDGELGEIGTPGVTATANFAYNPLSLTNPVEIASNLGTGGVLTCETAKMRYVANIAADTPAGVYTTKVNYLAAPQY